MLGERNLYVTLFIPIQSLTKDVISWMITTNCWRHCLAGCFNY